MVETRPLQRGPYGTAILLFLVAGGVQGCFRPPTTAECEAMDSADARHSCLKQVIFARTATDAAIGATTGATVGGLIGGAARGPHGALIGALSGAGVGAAAGGVIGYAANSQEEALADLRVENRRLNQMLERHDRSLSDSRQEVAALEVQNAVVKVDQSNSDQLASRLKAEIFNLKKIQQRILEDMTALTNEVNTLRTAPRNDYFYKSQIGNRTQATAELEIRYKEALVQMKDLQDHVEYLQTHPNLPRSSNIIPAS